MDLLQGVFHDVKYHWHYLAVDYRRKYYSTNRNPRVIQSKFQNQTLISLRTFPQCKYLIKPGEFLSVVPKDKKSKQTLNNPTELDLITPHEDDFFVGFDDTFLIRERRELVSKLNSIKRVNSAPELVSLRNELIGKHSCTCVCHDVTQQQMSNGEADESNLEGKASNLKDMIRYFMGAKKNNDNESSTNQSPFKGHESNMSLLQDVLLLPELDEGTSGQSPLRHSPQVSGIHSQLQSFVSKLGNGGSKLSYGSSGHPIVLESGGKTGLNLPADEKRRVWKTVLNEASLSAARISTGAEKSSDLKLRNFSSDFIDAKPQNLNNENDEVVKSADVFAANLEQAKRQFGRVTGEVEERKVDLKSKIEQIVQSQFGNDQKYIVAGRPFTSYSSRSRPFSTGEVYGEMGILSYYAASDVDE
ncbi:uncharacterized protein RJT20DRAFT_140687 [Scheffersomyces xylosifermentans]|uniref:uncharacterized protein n=1 Tax=Scheffersomyces xylosifermentans TaxID=1304137 RepID=UPI00315D468E